MENAELNLFRQARQLLGTREGDLTEEERQIVNTAEGFAINLLPKLEPEYDELPLRDSLEELARLVEQALVAGWSSGSSSGP